MADRSGGYFIAISMWPTNPGLITSACSILAVGFTSGEVQSLAMNLPLLKNYSVVGCYWGAWQVTARIVLGVQ